MSARLALGGRCGGTLELQPAFLLNVGLLDRFHIAFKLCDL
jgi:hypothetical protein